MGSHTQMVIHQFLKIYKSEPCLWDVTSHEYHDRNKKKLAYDRLVEVMKRIEPNSCRDSVVKKINNIRSAYRKEFKKVKKSTKSGDDPVYKPRLWYFDMLGFVNRQEHHQISGIKIESDNEEEQWNEETTDDDISREAVIDAKIEELSCPKFENCSEESSSTSVVRSVSPDPIGDSFLFESGSTGNGDLLHESCTNKPNPSGDDRFDLLGKSVAMKLRNLSKVQMLLAEKIINEVIFEAEMGNLTISCSVNP